MQSILAIINSESFIKIIGAIVILISCFLAAKCMFRRDITVVARKILGSIFIIGITMISNQIMTYSLAVIIIGTLIAETKFLEMIWATIFKNKDYFTSLATADAKRKKAINEINANSPLGFENIAVPTFTPGNTRGPGNSYDEEVNKVIGFKNEVEQVLVSEESGLFKPFNIKYDVEISDSDGQSVVIDGVAKGSKTNIYCIEIRQSCLSDTLNDNLEELRRNISALKKYYLKKNTNANVKGILVVPDSCALAEDFYDDFAILKYKQDTRSFSNKEKIIQWI